MTDMGVSAMIAAKKRSEKREHQQSNLTSLLSEVRQLRKELSRLEERVRVLDESYAGGGGVPSSRDA